MKVCGFRSIPFLQGTVLLLFQASSISGDSGASALPRKPPDSGFEPLGTKDLRGSFTVFLREFKVFLRGVKGVRV